MFYGLYSDKRLETVLNISSLSQETLLLIPSGLLNHYTVKFIMDGEVYNVSSQPYGSFIEYPLSNPNKKDSRLVGDTQTIFIYE